jgi:hypothetical protein
MPALIPVDRSYHRLALRTVAHPAVGSAVDTAADATVVAGGTPLVDFSSANLSFDTGEVPEVLVLGVAKGANASSAGNVVATFEGRIANTGDWYPLSETLTIALAATAAVSGFLRLTTRGLVAIRLKSLTNSDATYDATFNCALKAIHNTTK